MARRLDHSLSGSSTLSYIDMISGGFGAAFFLFLIFVSLPIETASTPSSGSRFLDVWVEWRDDTVLAHLTVTFTAKAVDGAPSAPRDYTLNSQALRRSMSTGDVVYVGNEPPFWSGIAEAGFGLSGDSGLKRRAKDGSWVGIWMRFSDPCPGDYAFTVASHAVSPARLRELIDDSDPVFTVDGRARLVLADGKTTVFQPDDGSEGVPVAFKAGLSADPKPIPFLRPVAVTVGPFIAESSLLHCAP